MSETPDLIPSGKTVLETLQAILAVGEQTLDTIIPRMTVLNRGDDKPFIVMTMETKDDTVTVGRVDHEFQSLAEIQIQMDEAKAELVR